MSLLVYNTHYVAHVCYDVLMAFSYSYVSSHVNACVCVCVCARKDHKMALIQMSSAEQAVEALVVRSAAV